MGCKLDEVTKSTNALTISHMLYFLSKIIVILLKICLKFKKEKKKIGPTPSVNSGTDSVLA